LIKQGFNEGVDHAGTDIGQPTSFFVGCALNLNPDNPELEIKNLRRKLRAGADYILTQPIYEPGAAKAFLKRYEEEFGKLPIPVLVGVLPLYNSRHANFLHHEVPGVVIPEEHITRLEKAGDSAPSEGVRIAVELVEEMKSSVQGVYIMPAFSRFDLAAEVIDAVHQLSD
jgi:homocysteine S-methyltransferase